MLKGSIVAIVTPFCNDGSVNYKKLGELLEFHIANKTDGIVILGTTGEASTLSDVECDEIVKYSVRKVNKRIPLIVGSGSNCTQTAISLSKKYEAMGADMLLVITPYYNRTNNKGMLNHFTSIANSVNIPIILYNVPGRTGCSIDVNVVKQLALHKNIVGIKEASGNISYVAKVARYISDKFALYSGNDDMIVPLLSLGGIGVISVWANIMPQTVHNMVFDYLDGKLENALKNQLNFIDLIDALFYETNPIPVKHAMNYLGYNVGPLRLPLDNMDENNYKKLVKEIELVKGDLK